MASLLNKGSAELLFEREFYFKLQMFWSHLFFSKHL